MVICEKFIYCNLSFTLLLYVHLKTCFKYTYYMKLCELF